MYVCGWVFPLVLVCMLPAHRHSGAQCGSDQNGNGGAAPMCMYPVTGLSQEDVLSGLRAIGDVAAMDIFGYPAAGDKLYFTLSTTTPCGGTMVL